MSQPRGVSEPNVVWCPANEHDSRMRSVKRRNGAGRRSAIRHVVVRVHLGLSAVLTHDSRWLLRGRVTGAAVSRLVRCRHRRPRLHRSEDHPIRRL